MSNFYLDIKTTYGLRWMEIYALKRNFPYIFTHDDIQRIKKVEIIPSLVMKKYAFSIFYLGDQFQGFQRQPNGFGIENYIEYSFIAGGYINSLKSSSYLNASRTDTGVHALGNIFSLFVSKEPNLDEINSYFPRNCNLLIHKIAEVPDHFNPRINRYKVYDYYLPDHFEIYNIERAQQYIGSHDFSRFIRRGGAGENNPVTNIASFDMIKDNDWRVLRIVGDSFGREQIRRMIGFLMEKKYSDFSPLGIISDNIKVSIRSAPAKFLVLKEIVYDEPIKWLSQELKSYFSQRIRQDTINKSNLARLKTNLTRSLIQGSNLS